MHGGGPAGAFSRLDWLLVTERGYLLSQIETKNLVDKTIGHAVSKGVMNAMVMMLF